MEIGVFHASGLSSLRCKVMARMQNRTDGFFSKRIKQTLKAVCVNPKEEL